MMEQIPAEDIDIYGQYASGRSEQFRLFLDGKLSGPVDWKHGCPNGIAVIACAITAQGSITPRWPITLFIGQ
jgi:hypothetical protein